jgi:hypothetical protein
MPLRSGRRTGQGYAEKLPIRTRPVRDGLVGGRSAADGEGMDETFCPAHEPAIWSYRRARNRDHPGRPNAQWRSVHE